MLWKKNGQKKPGDFGRGNMNTYKPTVDAKTGNPVIMLDGLSALVINRISFKQQKVILS